MKVASPISNNNPAHVSNHKAVSSEEKQKARNGGAGQTEGVAAGRQEDAVSLSLAARVLNETPPTRSQGQIRSSEHAAQVAQGLKALFEGSKGEALAVQAKNLNKDLIELLKAG